MSADTIRHTRKGFTQEFKRNNPFFDLKVQRYRNTILRDGGTSTARHEMRGRHGDGFMPGDVIEIL